MTTIAVLQMCSGVDPEANYAVIAQAARDAQAGGAAILFTPEMALLLDRNRERARGWIESDAPAQMAARLATLAQEVGIDIALGSMPIGAPGAKWANRALYCHSRGGEPVTYDKMHMFDVELSSGEAWRESSAYEPGRSVVSIDDTPVGRIGLAICYDMRFPALFEALGNRQCDCIAVPAAFTVPTGAAHWHVLLRARAIEASAFVVAAAQVGSHADGRTTYGHSLVVDPWGEVLLDMGAPEHANAPGLGFCEIDMGRIDEARAQVPALANRRAVPED